MSIYVLGIFFPRYLDQRCGSALAKITHFIPVGVAAVKLHLAGIPFLGASEVVVFSERQSRKAQVIMSRMKQVGVACRQVETRANYLDAYKKGNVEAASSVGDDNCIALNMSTVSGAMVAGLEDAIRIQLSSFHGGVRQGLACSGIRYFVLGHFAASLSFQMAPIWRTDNEPHNDIFEILSDPRPFGGSPKRMTLGNLWKIYVQLRPEEMGHEAFRKAFRTFKDWMSNNPCFHEKVGKSPEYRILLQSTQGNGKP